MLYNYICEYNFVCFLHTKLFLQQEKRITVVVDVHWHSNIGMCVCVYHILCMKSWTRLHRLFLRH